MNKSALGLVETYGYIGAVEALDVALKSANVKLVGCEFVKGGIVTIKIIGDVASVKASVEAAAIAADNLDGLITTHVIARVSDEVWKMLQKDFIIEQNNNNCLNKKEDNIESEILSEDSDNIIVNDEIEEVQKKIDVLEDMIFTRKELEDMKVAEIRTLARKLQITSMTKKQIKFGKKDQLIDAILHHRRGGES